MPQAHIDWLVAEAFADAVQHHPMLDGVVTFARDRLGKFGFSPAATREGLALARHLRNNRYDQVYDLQGLFRSGLLTWITRAPRRVGFANAREAAWLAYNVKYHVDPNLHTVDRMLKLLMADGINDPNHSDEADMRLYIGQNDSEWLQQFLTDNQIDEDAGYCCIAPTARWRCKCWPIERYAQITAKLIQEQIAGRHVIILASPSEKNHVEALVQWLKANHDKKLISQIIFPTTTVGKLMALLSQARLLICNDSAALHIAVGFNRPVVAVYGPTDPAKVGPYRKPQVIVQHEEAKSQTISYRQQNDDQTLIAKVSCDQVWDKITEQIQRSKLNKPMPCGKT